MSPEQRLELLNKVADMVGEHVNGFVFIADVDHDDFEEGKHESVFISHWSGGVTMCMGLVSRLQNKMSHEDLREEESL